MENLTVTLLSNKLRFWTLDAIPIIPRLHEGHRGGDNAFQSLFLIEAHIEDYAIILSWEEFPNM